MDILPGEVKSIKVVGNLFGDAVKMIKTSGGFHIFVGKKDKYSKDLEALAGSSHPAIGIYQLSKDYGVDFQPALAKSESDKLEVVENKTDYLSKNEISKGIELFTLSKNNKIDFVLYKQGITLGKYEAVIENRDLIVKNYKFSPNASRTKETANAIARAMEDKVEDLKLNKIINRA